MPKAKQSKRRKKFDYNKNRKNLKKTFQKKEAPRIECKQIRKAWNEKRTVARNLRDMGLAFDPNLSLPIKKKSILFVEKDPEAPAPARIIKKPYVVNQLEAEANRPVKDTKTLSTDMQEYVQHMIRHHGENSKAMARDEKNYYQDTPAQIRRKIAQYKRCHPKEYQDFMTSLGQAMT